MKMSLFLFIKKYSFLISNLLMAAGVAVAIYVFAEAYLFTGNLAAGSCPLTTNRTWIYISIALLVLSVVFSFFEKRKTSK